MALKMTVKKIGLWSSTALIAGNMIGSGIFLLPATLASYGGISLFGWLFSALGAFKSVFMCLSDLHPDTKIILINTLNFKIWFILKRVFIKCVLNNLTNFKI